MTILRILRTKVSKGSGAIIIIALALFLVLAAQQSGWTLSSEIESRTWDWRVLLTSDSDRADSRIKIIEIDQASLDFFDKEYGLTWPFPRETYNYAIDFLNKAGARALAFDILFAESSAQSVDGDRRFAEATNGPLPVVSAVSLNSYSSYSRDEKKKLFSERQREFNTRHAIDQRYPQGADIPRFSYATLPIPELLEHSAAFGAVQAEPDSDGVYRHYKAISYLDDSLVLAMPFALLEAGGANKGDLSQFLDEQGRLSVRLHGGSSAYQRISFASVVQAQADIEDGKEPRLKPEIFKDAWVFIGTSAPGLLDLRPTSLERRGQGVQYIASVLDNALNRDFIRKLGSIETMLISAALIVLSAWSTLAGGQGKRHFVWLIAFWAAFLLVTLVGASRGYWIPLVLPLTSAILTAMLCFYLQYQLEGRQHRFIRGAFQHYVSPELVKQIAERPAALSLGGEKREVSVFFSDIAGFTSISEKLDPAKLVQLLNEYLTLMTDLIQERDGTVDKYVGDAVVAFWNAPLYNDRHAIVSLEAAIACQQALLSHKDKFLSSYGVFPATRIGINTAEVSVGNFGSKSRFDYTVIGDGANLASRIEGANKNFGTYLLFSESSRQHLGESIRYRRVADIQVIGREQAVRVYEPHYHDSQSVFSDGNLSRYEEAIEMFDRGELVLAKSIFKELTEDPVSQEYCARIERELQAEFSLETWNASWSLQQK